MWSCRPKLLAVAGVNRIPAGIGFVEASLAEPLACVLNGQTLARVGEGDDVVVIGAGPIGCLHVRLARARGAARVFLVGRNRARLALAADLVRPDAVVDASTTGVVEAVGALTEGHGADVVIVAASSGEAQEEALLMAAPQGRISVFAGLPEDNPVISCNANLVHYRELTIVGATGSTPAHNAQALALIAGGSVPVADLITHRLPLSDALAAFDLVARGDAIKVVLEP